MDFGTAIHDTLELFRCKEPDPAITLDIAVFLFKEKFKYLFEKNRDSYQEKELEKLRLAWVPGSLSKKGIVLGDFLVAGERILRRFDECDELRGAQVMFNEYKLEEPIGRTDGLKILFKGYIDMVIKTRAKNGDTVLYVIDFKGAPWGWSVDKKNNKELHFQILLYKHFLCKKHGLDPKYVRTAFVLLKRAPRIPKGSTEPECPVEFLPISAGPVSVQRAVDELNRDITRLKLHYDRDSFVKNRKSCIDDWGEICPYYETEHCV
jgi:hypothetical protein